MIRDLSSSNWALTHPFYFSEMANDQTCIKATQIKEHELDSPQLLPKPNDVEIPCSH